MHPNAAFRHDDRALLAAMVDEIGFGMVFAATPDGPRVAHTPLLLTRPIDSGAAVQFHLSRGNALTKHLNGATVLALVNGPDGYVSPRWYADPAQVPTWNYLSLELEGRVRRLDADGLLTLVEGLSERHEDRVSGGEPWTMAKLPDAKLRGLLAGIVGFELEVLAWRPTFKLSQNKSPEERERVAAGLEAQGSPALAALMRSLGGAG
jgi:transcriptional regulator